MNNFECIVTDRLIIRPLHSGDENDVLEILKDDYRSGMRKLLDRFSEKYPMEKGYEELLRKMLGRVSR